MGLIFAELHKGSARKPITAKAHLTPDKQASHMLGTMNSPCEESHANRLLHNLSRLAPSSQPPVSLFAGAIFELPGFGGGQAGGADFHSRSTRARESGLLPAMFFRRSS